MMINKDAKLTAVPFAPCEGVCAVWAREEAAG